MNVRDFFLSKYPESSLLIQRLHKFSDEKLHKTFLKRHDDLPMKEHATQNLDPYWNPDFAKGLESWGNGNAWEEIQFLVSGCDGRILDIACGTRKVIQILHKFPK